MDSCLAAHIVWLSHSGERASGNSRASSDFLCEPKGGCMTTLSGKQWRDKVHELPIDPDLPIVDAHHHVWDASPLPDIEAYSPDAFLSDKAGSGHNIVATVAVDCRTN